ncbi:MAG: chemotaxis protein CheX [Caldicoprobacterales bacterium]|jgi:chemotaxis protein CheX|nr:chemotaxis protein CheX [Clostridiales bacterium]
MDVKYILPFLESIKSVLEQFGVDQVKRGQLAKNHIMHVNNDITAVVGVVGQVRGNIAYSMSEDTAQRIVSAMMMGMPVIELDEMGRSAIGEFANMVTGNASILLSNSGLEVDVTPPSIIFGRNVFFIISTVDTIKIDMETSLGRIEVNIGLEI